MSKNEDLLSSIFEGLSKELLNRIQSGTATATILNVARQFLKDNGIDAVRVPGSTLDNLANNVVAFPFPQHSEGNDDYEVG